MNNRLRVLIAIEFKRFMYSNKKIDTLRDYVTFFIRIGGYKWEINYFIFSPDKNITVGDYGIDVATLEAINQQCKELGWI